MYWLVQQGTQPLPAPDLQTLGIASPSLEAILLELAVRSLTPAEQQIKRAALKTAPSSFGWSKDDAVTIPELALHALLSRRQHAFGEMPLSARMQWIGRLPRMHNDADSVPGNLINLVLEAASLDTPGLHADEKQLLRERSGLLLKHAEDWFSNDHCGLRLRAAWLCRIRLYEAGELDLAFELEVLFRDHQDRELARFLFPHYVVALAEVAADTLEREIRTVLSQELARGEDVAKWIQPTEQVVSSCKPHVQPGIQALLAEFAMRAGGARTGHSKIPDHPQSRPR